MLTNIGNQKHIEKAYRPCPGNTSTACEQIAPVQVWRVQACFLHHLEWLAKFIGKKIDPKIFSPKFLGPENLGLMPFPRTVLGISPKLHSP